jgi:hypothetical protein
MEMLRKHSGDLHSIRDMLHQEAVSVAAAAM